MTPQLRFSEFTDEWRVRKFSEIADGKLSNGVFNDPSKVGSGYKLINVKDMYVDGFIDESSLTKVNINAREFSKNKVKNGDLFFTRSSLVKEGIAYTNIYLSNSEDITFDGHLIKLSPDKAQTSPEFLYYISKSNASRRQLVTFGTTTTMTTIGQREVANVILYFPSKPEQEKIADFLTAVDERIGVSEKKLELLETYKRGVMQKIFSQAIRFKDANGNPYPDWEEKKLGEVSKIKTGDSDVQDAVADGEYPFFIRSKEVKRSNKYIYDGEAILIPGEGGIGEIFHYINGKFNYHQRVYKISDFEAKTHGKYVLYFIHQNFARQANKHSVKATVDSLRLPTFTDFSVSLPCKEEQQKIATFLTTLDEKITAEKSKLTATRQFKKALLQRMFI